MAVEAHSGPEAGDRALSGQLSRLKINVKSRIQGGRGIPIYANSTAERAGLSRARARYRYRYRSIERGEEKSCVYEHR